MINVSTDYDEKVKINFLDENDLEKTSENLEANSYVWVDDEMKSIVLNNMEYYVFNYGDEIIIENLINGASIFLPIDKVKCAVSNMHNDRMMLDVDLTNLFDFTKFDVRTLLTAFSKRCCAAIQCSDKIVGVSYENADSMFSLLDIDKISLEVKKNEDKMIIWRI